MPFTPSHVAAVLPFVRTPLPAAALVIGSMIPDLPRFVPIGVPRGLTHSAIGAFTADLPLGLVALALWFLVFRAPLHDFAPEWLRVRLPPMMPVSDVSRPRFLLRSISGVFVGITTHLVWDSFTHSDGRFVLAVPLFQAELGPFTINRWLQYGSSLAGLTIVVVWLVRWIRRTGPRSEPPSIRLTEMRRFTAWLLVAIPGLAVALATWTGGISGGDGILDRDLVYRAVTLSISFAGLIAILIAIGWYFLPQRSLVVSREE